jgi:hypothetical protein
MDNSASSAMECCVTEWWSSDTHRVARIVTSSACGKPMAASKRASGRALDSDLGRIAAHVIKPHEYVELPELTDKDLGQFAPARIFSALTTRQA